MVAQKVEVLKGHCAALGRDIGEIEVSAFAQVRPDATPGDVLRSAEAMAAVRRQHGDGGRLTGLDPAAALGGDFHGPAMERLAALQPTPL